MTIETIYGLLGLVCDWFHNKLMQDYLGPFVRKERDCIVVTPPGMGKTALVIATIVTIFVRDPKAHVIVLSNGESLAHMIVRNVLRILQSEVIQTLRPLTFSKATESQFTIAGNDGRPSLLGAGTRTVLVGNRCDYLIVDDGVRDQSQALSAEMDRIWDNFQHVAETRILPEGRVLIVGTRWALSDLVGRIMDRASKNSLARAFHFINLALTNAAGRDSYELFSGSPDQPAFIKPYKVLPTLKKQPFSCSARDAQRKLADLGPVAYQMVQMGRPSSRESALWQPQHFAVVSELRSDEALANFLAVDTAMGSKSTSDPMALVQALLMRDGSILFVDCFEQVINTVLQEQVIEEKYDAAWKRIGLQPLLIIEKASSGEPIANSLKSRWGNRMAIELHPATKEKYLRGIAAQGTIVSGAVRVYERMPLAEKFITDMVNYPLDSRNDHIPDAAVMLVAHIRKVHKPLVGNTDHFMIAQPKRLTDYSEHEVAQAAFEIMSGGEF